MPFREMRAALLLVYVLLLMYGSWLPLSSSWNWTAGGLAAFLAMDIREYTTVSDVALNLLIYVPAGFLGASLLSGSALTRLLTVTLTGCVLSLILEFGQTFLPDRITSLSDMAFNTSGSLLGAVAWLSWQWHRRLSAMRS